MGILDMINNPQYIEVKFTEQSIVDAVNHVLGTNIKVKDVFGDEKNNTNHIGRNHLRGMSK